MNHTDSRGIIVTDENSIKRTDYLYRISIKALIYNDNGELLLTREAGRDWHLPGGGIEYGETVEEALKRELQEEVGYVGGVEYRIIGTDPMWMDNLEVYQMWIVALVKIDNMDFKVGESGEGLTFKSPEELKKLAHIDSRRTLKFHKLAQELSRE